jgi:tetratricopeptide (TPR) repeat protein
LFGLGDVALYRGDLGGADAYFRLSLERSERIENDAFAGFCFGRLSDVALYRGDLAAAEEHARRSLSLVHGVGDRHAAAECWISLAHVACERGDLAAAARRCRRAACLARYVNSAQQEVLADLARVRIYLRGIAAQRDRQGSVGLQEAMARLDRSRASIARYGWAQPTVHVALLTAELRLLGDASVACMAVRPATEALRRATQGQMRREQALAHRLLGQCALVGGALVEAEMHLRSALTMLGEMGAALDAARAATLLAETIAAGANGGRVPHEACRLEAEAQTCFNTRGATLDAAWAARLASAWQAR